MQFRLWDQNGVSKGLTLDSVLRQLIPAQNKLVTKLMSAPAYPNYSLPWCSPTYISANYCFIRVPSPTPPSIISSPKLHFCAEIGGRLLDGVSGLNPAGAIDVCLFRVCWRADHSSREVLPSVCVCVCVSDWDLGTSIMRRSWPSGAVKP